ncbi:unnamed protein product [Cladocopium goreaui]|uniref:Protein terminal ear1-like n=1 Tax=Cladocopium goreaui TaxID=2562237 RepID=A0A9P1D1R0_9DINO|nr:unnamed protein product [Cladocopium goreaui]
MEVPSRLSPETGGTFGQAYKPKEAAFYGRLKEATMDLGAAHIDSLRAIFTSRVLQTRARLHGLTLSNSQNLDIKRHQYGLRGNVLALGLGLLERTEAVLDLLLQLAESQEHGEDHVAAVQDAVTEDCHRPISFLQVPRVISTQVLQTIVVPLSRSHTVRVTYVGVQDTCSSLMNLLRVQELWQLLRGLHSWAQEKQKELTDDVGTTGTPAVAVRAANIARRGCERLLGESRFERLLNSHILVRLLGERTSASTEDTNFPQTQAGVLVEEVFEGQRRFDQSRLGDLGELQSGSGRCIHVVVKNSFIELVEEKSPRELRRAQSCDAVFAAAERAQENAVTVAIQPSLQMGEAERGDSPVAVVTIPSDLSDHHSSSSRAQPAEVAGNVPSVELAIGHAGEEIVDDHERMTVMLRNIPQEFTRDHILHLLDWAGFHGRYDFVYLPVDFTRGRSLGYALVGLVSHEAAQDLLERLEGSSFPGEDPSLRCQASWSLPHRGLEGHIERYRNSPVMHPSMPDEYKPVIFENGQRVDFPPPTKTIRAPRIRHPKAGRRPAQETRAG